MQRLFGPTPVLWPALAVIVAFFVFGTEPALWWLGAVAYAMAMPFIAGDALTFVTGALFGFVVWTGSTTLEADLAILVILSAIAIVGRIHAMSNIARSGPDSSRKSDIPRRFADVVISLAFLAAAFTALSGTYHILAGGRIARGSAPPAEADGPRVGLALSGGGYRAALFHAGVIQGLKRFKIPISAISGVSGGSIAETAYAEGIAPSDFAKAIIAGRFNLFRPLLNIESVWGYTFVLPGASRLAAQSRLLDDLILQGDRFSAFSDSPLKLMIVVSDLSDGRALGITPRGALERSLIDPEDPQGLYQNVMPERAEQLAADIAKETAWTPRPADQAPETDRTSIIVSASGAFPGAFEPLSLPDADLVDGGVTDNSAVSLLLDADFFSRHCVDPRYADLASWREDLVIASDGSQPFELKGRYGPITGALRAIDTGFARVSPKPLYMRPSIREEHKYNGPPTVLLSPAAVLDANHTDADNRVLTQLLTELKLHLTDVGYAAIEGIHALVYAPLDQTFKVTEVANWKDQHQDGGPAPNTENWQYHLGQELVSDASVFYSSPTLSASYTEERAMRIFRLGWLLVALNSARLTELVDNAARARKTMALSSADGAESFCPALHQRS